jgi:hypothetical protein
MYFSITVAFAALPFLVGAVPVDLGHTRSVISIPLSQRSTHFNADGLIDVEKMQANVHQVAAFVFPVLFLSRLDP